MRYLLDTNICIYIIKQRPPHVFERFRRHPIGNVSLSVISYSELAYGVAKSSRPEKNELALQSFVAPLRIEPFPPDAAPIYGRIRAELRRVGKPIGPLDLLIAAHALCLGAVLVTNNVAEFDRVPGLKLENWAEPVA